MMVDVDWGQYMLAVCCCAFIHAGNVRAFALDDGCLDAADKQAARKLQSETDQSDVNRLSNIHTRVRYT